MRRTKPGASVLLTAGLLIASIGVATLSGAVASTDAPGATALAAHVRPAALTLEVGQQAIVRVYVCPDIEGAIGADQRPGTADDDCQRGAGAALDMAEGISVERQGRDGSRWRITADEPGLTSATFDIDDTEAALLPVFVAEPIPADDRAAIGTRGRSSGDVDDDGRVTDRDAELLADLVLSAPGRYLETSDPAVPTNANVLGGPFVTMADVAELEARARQQRVRDRALERARVDITPRDIIPVHAGGVGIVGAVLDATNRADLPGTFGVNLVGGDRLYYPGPGGWGGAGEVPVSVLYEQPAFMVFSVPQPGFGFVGHQRPGSDAVSSVSFEAVEPGQDLALPPPGGRLTVPLDVDRDHDVDGDDYVRMLVSLGTRAGDRGFPARGDVDADGVITLADLEAIAPAVALFGAGPLGGPAGSGDLDADGDLDARDVRGALAHLNTDRETGRLIIADALPAAAQLLELADALATPAVLDMDGDGVFGTADVGAMAVMAQVELGSLGPYYHGLDDARRVAVPAGSPALDLDGDGVLGPGDATDLLTAIDDVLAGRITDPEALQRFDLDGDGAVDLADLVPLRLAITGSADADA